MTRTCKDCGEAKPLSAFPDRSGAAGGGISTLCRPCLNKYYRDRRKAILADPVKGPVLREQEKAAAQRRRARTGHDREASRRWRLKSTYGLTPEMVDQMLLAQGQVCCICLEPDPDNIDHDHETGRVRGILCGDCNIGLGRFKDAPDRLRAAADYLEAGLARHSR